MGTGFMKCVLITREAAVRSVGLSGGAVAAAIFVIEMEEVLVERMACAGATLASFENISAFNDGISGTASIMKSALERSSILVVGERRERAESASDWEIRCFDTFFSNSLSVGVLALESQRLNIPRSSRPANFMPLSNEACELSTRVTGTLAFCAATSAMPRP